MTIRLCSPNTLPDFKPFRMGWEGRDDTWARDVKFNSNETQARFWFAGHCAGSQFSVIWILQLKVTDQKGYAVKSEDISIFDKNQLKVLQKKNG